MDLFNQREAAEYITKRGLKMTDSWLSKLTSMDLGPKYERKGNVKLFLREDVDAWVDVELLKVSRKAAQD